MTKNGPKGIAVPNILFFRHKISMHPAIAPVKNATYRLITMPGKPKIRPIKKANFTSPNPIPLPFVPKNNNKKNKHAPTAENRLGSIK